MKTPAESDLLKKWVAESLGGNPHFNLLWRGSRDGYLASVFHSKCDAKGPTLTIIRNTEGKTFGGFTSIPWQSSANDAVAKDTTAFIYSLSNSGKCAQQGNDNSAISNAGYGPIFGYQEGYGYDICVMNECNTATNQFIGNFTYALPQGSSEDTFLCGGSDYTVQEIEVYAVVKA